MKLLHVVGARPNFMKVAPVWQAVAEQTPFQQVMVHTGQHYDVNMSDVFFADLGLPAPDHHLGVGAGTHAQQTAAVLVAFEEVVLETQPDLVLVYGDVNSTVAAALVCAKLSFGKLRTGIPVGHVEAGLRSFDRTMPEEINRLLTDQISDLLFTPSPDGDENLLKEGVSPEKIFLVGNVMIDTLVRLLPAALERWDARLSTLYSRPYALVTLHRPSNVDSPVVLTAIMDALEDISQDLPVIFAVHPRTRQRLAALSFQPATSSLRLVDPLGYLDFLALEKHATVVITDSGGIQEEMTYLGVPCLTVRENTERPVTVTLGTNTLVGHDMDRLRVEVGHILDGQVKRGEVPPLWDGRAADRIAVTIEAWGRNRERAIFSPTALRPKSVEALLEDLLCAHTRRP